MERDKDYFASDFNVFVNKFCTHKMTAINIDCFILRFSDDGHRARFIESKHTLEGWKKGQENALKVLSQVTHPSIKFESFIVRGEYPFDIITIETIDGKNWTIDRDTLIKWCEFEVELE